jgi:hypothetical protein
MPFMFGIALLANGSAVHASGSLPIAEEKMKFKSHADCVASLRNDLQQDRDETTNGRIGFRDGMTREIALVTDGLVRHSRHRTSYRSVLRYILAAPMDQPSVAPVVETANGDVQAPKTRVSHSYKELIRVCNRRTKTVTGTQGYTLDTFE